MHIYNQINIKLKYGVEYECNVRKCKWKRHEESKKHRMTISGEHLGGHRSGRVKAPNCL